MTESKQDLKYIFFYTFLLQILQVDSGFQIMFSTSLSVFFKRGNHIRDISITNQQNEIQ